MSAKNIAEGFGEVCDVLIPVIGKATYRMVQAVQLGPDRFRIEGGNVNVDELLFRPGQIVRCIIKVLSEEEAQWLAVEAVDPPSDDL